MQTAADVFGMAIHRPHTHETSGLGAAICAAVGTGVYPDFPTAVQAMSRVVRIFYPHAERAAVHDRLFQQVYRPWIKSLAELYARGRG
jgi:ribulose kinase